MQPPASLKALSDPIYEAFYGLTEQPFAITTDPRFFYLSASHQRAFSELLNGLRRREGLMLLTGETGAGKTTLCRAVIDALGERTFAAMVLNPYMSGAEVLRIVLRDFGLVSHEDLRRGGLASADVPQLLDTLEGFLKSLAPLGSHAVIVLDEAQSVPPQTLDQIRLLTALEHQGRRLVQVVLCGQSGLLAMLKTDALSALNERITRRVEVGPLPADQVAAYIQHRLGVAGGGDAVAFDAAAARVIADLSRGVPRRINVLCDRALQEGRIEGVNTITADLVKRAARAVAGAHDPLPVLPNAPPTPVVPPRSAAPPASTPVPAPAAPSTVVGSVSDPLRSAMPARETFGSPTASTPATASASAPAGTSPAAPAAAAATAIPAATRGVSEPTAPAASSIGNAPGAATVSLGLEGRARADVHDRTDTTAVSDGASVGVVERPAEVSSALPVDPGLTFGQSDSAPAAGGRTRLIVLAAAGVALALAGAYLLFARSVPDPASVIPGNPPPSVNGAWPPAGPRPVPSPEEIATIDEMFPPARRAVDASTDPLDPADSGELVPLSPDVPAADPVASPLETQPPSSPPALPQVPEDGNQIN